MNISKTVSGIKIQPSFKLWWNKYNLKVEITGFDKLKTTKVFVSVFNKNDFLESSIETLKMLKHSQTSQSTNEQVSVMVI